MLLTLAERVSVITKYDCMRGTITPVKIKWQGREYVIKRVGYYHRARQGRTLQHIFHVTDGAWDFRLRCDSDDLHWYVEQVSDGNAA